MPSKVEKQDRHAKEVSAIVAGAREELERASQTLQRMVEFVHQPLFLQFRNRAAQMIATAHPKLVTAMQIIEAAVEQVQVTGKLAPHNPWPGPWPETWDCLRLPTGAVDYANIVCANYLTRLEGDLEYHEEGWMYALLPCLQFAHDRLVAVRGEFLSQFGEPFDRAAVDRQYDRVPRVRFEHVADVLRECDERSQGQALRDWLKRHANTDVTLAGGHGVRFMLWDQGEEIIPMYYLDHEKRPGRSDWKHWRDAIKLVIARRSPARPDNPQSWQEFF
ncbi:MAG: hypothetical protein HYY50_00300 [Candidatus Kerfeldbacteria bacterium]|nr:hypothetical protein [Candidatus Kerfeldbacteria bacterium]